MKKIAIVGAGISGLILASFIKKNTSFKVSLFEKDNIKNNTKNGIQISPNGVRILRKIDFDNFDENKFYSIKSISFYDCIINEKFATMDLNYLDKNTYLTLDRTDLINFFINQFSLRDNLINQEVINVDQKSVFLSDRSKIDFDCIVVADGIFSKLRPKDIKPIYSGYSAIRGFFISESQNSEIDLFMGKHFHLVKYPTDKNKNNSFTLIKKMSEKTEISNYNFQIQNFVDEYKSFLPKYTHEIFNVQKVNMWPLYKIKRIYYGENGVFFIGDSSHGFIPSRAQGATQSIEDAFVLFNLMIQDQLSIKKIFQIREKRIKKIICKSENNLKIFHQSFFIIRFIRNFFIKILCKYKFLTKKINSYIFDYNFNLKL